MVADELDDGHLDFNEREKRVDELRTEAMKEIWSSRGLAGALALLADCDPWTVGRYAACRTGDQQAIFDVLQTCLATEPDSSGKLDGFIQGFIWFIDEDVRSTIVSTLAETATVDQYVRLLVCSPFRHTTWHLLDRQNSAVRDRYWRTVVPRPWRFSESETNEIIDRFLDVKRSRAALLRRCGSIGTRSKRRACNGFSKPSLAVVRSPQAISRSKLGISPRRWTHSTEGRASRWTRWRSWSSRAATCCYCCVVPGTAVTGIPNLERRVSQSPDLFVQVLALVFKREDGGQDPPEWRVDDSGRGESVHYAAVSDCFNSSLRVPGADDRGVDAHALSRWVTDARRLCREHGRCDDR